MWLNHLSEAWSTLNYFAYVLTATETELRRALRTFTKYLLLKIKHNLKKKKTIKFNFKVQHIAVHKLYTPEVIQASVAYASKYCLLKKMLL